MWVTVNQAAASLGVSERTIQRRIKRGTMEVRHHNGKVTVEVDRPDAVSVVADGVDKLSQAAAASAIERHTDREHVGKLLDILSASVRHERRSARWAWGLAAVSILAAVGVGIVHHRAQIDNVRSVAMLQADLAGHGRTIEALTADAAGLKDVIEVLSADKKQLTTSLETFSAALRDATHRADRLDARIAQRALERFTPVDDVVSDGPHAHTLALADASFIFDHSVRPLTATGQ